MFRKGTRLLSIAAVILVLEAVLHTMGSFAPPPDDATLLALIESMRGVRLPVGLGMEPSIFDIQRALALALTALFLLMAAVGIALPAAAPGSRRVYRTTVALLLAANVVLLALWWSYRIAPPLLFQTVLSLLLLAALFGGAGERA